MRILLLSVHPPQGGGSAHSSQELAVGLRSLGHYVLQVAPYRSQTDRADYPDLLWFAADFPDGLQITPEAQQTIDDYVQQVYVEYGKFDWVILGRESFLWQVQAIRAVHQGSIAVIVRGAYINKLVSQSSELLTQLPEAERQLREQLIQLYRSCDRIICIAQHLVTSVQKVVGEGEIPVTFLPNPIDLSDFTAIAPPRPAPNSPIQLFMAAQLKARKRPLDAVEIMHHLVAQGADCYLTICGDGVDRQQMLDLMAHYGLEQRISLKGKLARGEIIQYLQQAEIVLLCSDNEGRPRVLQEAIAASRAIVAYDNPGSREVINSWIEPWQWGKLVAIGDTVGASNAIIELAQLLRHNHPRSIPIPSSQSILQQYVDLFQKGIPEGSDRHPIITLKPKK